MCWRRCLWDSTTERLGISASLRPLFARVIDITHADNRTFLIWNRNANVEERILDSPVSRYSTATDHVPTDNCSH